MKRVSAIATAVCLALLVALALHTSRASAQDFNPLEKTYLTFSGPVELPGMTLAAGTYRFQLADTESRKVVQVYSEDGQKIYGQFLFAPARRLEVTSEPVVTFKESAEGTTPAIQYWFYPNASTGKEFIYPKDQAMRIARRTHSPVLSTDGDISANSTVSSIDENGNVTAWEPDADNAPLGGGQAEASQAAVPAQPTAAAGSLAGNRQPAERSDDLATDTVGTSGQADTTNQVAANELPRTASPLPISGLLGLLSLAGGVGVRAFRSR
jgi:hypothetical protein